MSWVWSMGILVKILTYHLFCNTFFILGEAAKELKEKTNLDHLNIRINFLWKPEDGDEIKPFVRKSC